jgi:hypothetical protein
MREHFLAEQGMHDPEWDALVQSFRERNPADRGQTAQDLAGIASVYRRHERHWFEFNEAQGISSLELGRKAVSKFHPACRHLCGLGLAGDETGRASVLAGFLDIWETTHFAPSEIPAWIAGTPGGIRAIYNSKGRRFPDLTDRVIANRDSNIHTSDLLARRIVESLPIESNHFCVDACCGRGAFFQALPKGRRDWCEIREGRDFRTYEFDRHINWVITNPPWSVLYGEIAKRAFTTADHVVFLVRLDVALNSYDRHKTWREAGHRLREIHIVPWKLAEFVREDGTPKQPEGFCLAWVWWSRGWTGGIRLTYWDDFGESC